MNVIRMAAGAGLFLASSWLSPYLSDVLGIPETISFLTVGGDPGLLRRHAVLLGGETVNIVLCVLMVAVTAWVFMRSFRYHIMKMDTEVRDVV